MGLFDQLGALGNLSPDQQQGLLAAAQAFAQAGAPSRTPVSFAQALSSGLGGYTQGVQNSQKQRQDKEDALLQNQLRALQIQGLGGELQDKETARQQQLAAQRIAQQYQSGLLSPTARAQSVLGTNMAPTADNAAALNASPAAPSQDAATEEYTRRIGLANLLRANGLFPQADAQEMAALKFKPEFDQTPRVAIGSDGKPFTYVLDKSGNTKRLDGVLPRDELHFQDTGGGYAGLDKFTGQPVITGKKTASADSLLSNQLGWANFGLSKDRLTFDKQQAVDKASIEKAPTEFQGKSASYGLRAREADKTLSGLTGSYSPGAINSKATVSDWPLIGGALGAATNYALSENDQKAEQAQRDFVNAVLRQESGAAIGASEFDNAKKQYFPQSGDKPAVIEQKARNRQLAIQGLEASAGRAKLTAPAAKGTWSIQRVGE